jgi:hypothetical protein
MEVGHYLIPFSSNCSGTTCEASHLFLSLGQLLKGNVKPTTLFHNSITTPLTIVWGCDGFFSNCSSTTCEALHLFLSLGQLLKENAKPTTLFYNSITTPLTMVWGCDGVIKGLYPNHLPLLNPIFQQLF